MSSSMRTKSIRKREKVLNFFLLGEKKLTIGKKYDDESLLKRNKALALARNVIENQRGEVNEKSDIGRKERLKKGGRSRLSTKAQ